MAGTRRRHAALLRPAIFGLADGCMSLLGVIIYLHTGPAAVVLPAAAMGGISSAASMAGGEYMSDSDNGLMPSLVMGLATGFGGILPAIPFAFTGGTAALAWCIAIVIGIGGVVGYMRGEASTKRSRKYELVATFILLGIIFAVVLVCGVIFPNPG